MHCAARELGRFHLAKQGYPAHSLRAFVLARCGTMTTDVQMNLLGGTVPEASTDEEIFSRWRPQVIEMLSKLSQDPDQSIGLWFGREGKQAIFFLASGRRLVDVMAFGPGQSPNQFVLAGRIPGDTAGVRALINRGRFRVAECTIGRATLPAFAISCEASPDDEYAWIEIAAFPPGRILGKTVLNAVVFPKGVPVDRYVRATIADPRPVSSADDVTAGLLAAVNAIRETAGLTPLVLDSGQSSIASRLAAHYFAALFGKLPSTIADQIVLGLRAGWDVEGVVRSGKLTSTLSAGDTTVGLMASTAIERPFGREVLFDPDARRLAIGPLVIGDGGAPIYGAVLATYSLFSGEEAAGDPRKVVLDLLAQRRAESGRAAPRAIALGDGVAQTEAGLVAGKVAPREALDQVMRQASAQTRAAVNGWVMEVSELDRLEFPPELIGAENVEVAVGVSYYQPNDEPWGRYVVMIVVVRGATTI